MALERGKVDAAVLEYIDLQLAGDEFARHKNLGALSDLSPITAEGVFAVSGKRLREHPEQVRRFVDGMLDGFAAVYGPGGRKAFVAEAGKGPYFNGSDAIAGKVYDYHRSIELWPRREQPFTAPEYARTVRFYKGHEMIEKSARFGDLWDLSFWR